MSTAPTNVCPSVTPESEDYGSKVSVNGAGQGPRGRGHSKGPTSHFYIACVKIKNQGQARCP